MLQYPHTLMPFKQCLGQFDLRANFETQKHTLTYTLTYTPAPISLQSKPSGPVSPFSFPSVLWEPACLKPSYTHLLFSHTEHLSPAHQGSKKTDK